MYMSHGFHLNGNKAAVFAENLLRFIESGTSFNDLNKIRRRNHSEAKDLRHR